MANSNESEMRSGREASHEAFAQGDAKPASSDMDQLLGNEGKAREPKRSDWLAEFQQANFEARALHKKEEQSEIPGRVAFLFSKSETQRISLARIMESHSDGPDPNSPSWTLEKDYGEWQRTASYEMPNEDRKARQAVRQLVEEAINEDELRRVTLVKDRIYAQTETFPYRDLLKRMKRGLIVPFIGAGVSIWHDEEQRRRWEPTLDEEGNYIYPDFPPSGAELAVHLAHLCGFPGTSFEERSDLAQVASFYRCRARDRNLQDVLRDIFTAAKKTNGMHELIATAAADAAKSKRPMMIVTTNYDRLIEDALLAKGIPFDVIVHRAPTLDCGSPLFHIMRYKHEDNKGPEPEVFVGIDATTLEYKKIDPEKRTTVYKMHGSVFSDVAMDSFVISEEDYLNFMLNMNTRPPSIPHVIKSYVGKRSFLFMGYGLKDTNLRMLLHSLEPVLPSFSTMAAEGGSRKNAQAGNGPSANQEAGSKAEPSPVAEAKQEEGSEGKSPPDVMVAAEDGGRPNASSEDAVGASTAAGSKTESSPDAEAQGQSGSVAKSAPNAKAGEHEKGVKKIVYRPKEIQGEPFAHRAIQRRATLSDKAVWEHRNVILHSVELADFIRSYRLAEMQYGRTSSPV